MCLRCDTFFASFVRMAIVSAVLVLSITAVLSSAEQTLIKRTFVSKDGVRSTQSGARLYPKTSSALSCARQCLAEDCYGAHFNEDNGECFALDYIHLYNTTKEPRWTLMTIIGNFTLLSNLRCLFRCSGFVKQLGHNC